MKRRSPSRIGAALAARISVLAPDWLRAMFWGRPMARRLSVVEAAPKRGQISADILTGDTAPTGKRRGARTVDLQVPVSHFLVRSVTAPRGARGKLETLAELDLRHRTPFWAAGCLCSAWRTSR